MAQSVSEEQALTLSSRQSRNAVRARVYNINVRGATFEEPLWKFVEPLQKSVYAHITASVLASKASLMPRCWGTLMRKPP